MTRTSGAGGTDWYLIPGDDPVAPGDECEHDDMTFLRTDRGNNQYYRCEDCRNVLVKKGSLSTTERIRIRDQRSDEAGSSNSILRRFGAGDPGSGRTSETGNPDTDEDSLEPQRRWSLRTAISARVTALRRWLGR